jgi:cytochrome P450
MERVAADMLVRMLNHISTGGDDAALPMLRWLSTVPRKPQAIDMVPKPEWISKLLVRRRLEDWKAEADRTLRRLIDDRRDPGWVGGHDLLWRLAHARDRQTGEPLSHEETRDEAASIIAAGDATIRALTWIWYLLALHPHVESRMHAELDEVLGDAKLKPEDIARVPYTKRVLDEVMRLYPPIPVIVRKALKADVVCGIDVPRGSIVTVAPFLIHRHKQLWERPDVFDPDRFEDENRRKTPRFAFIPFAAGPRVCPGASASTSNLMFSIVTLARQFRFRLATTAPIVPFGGISLQPKGGLPMMVERRK